MRKDKKNTVGKCDHERARRHAENPRGIYCDGGVIDHLAACYLELTARLEAQTEPQTVYDDIRDEVARSYVKHPTNVHNFTALVEEVGELAQALLEDQGAQRVHDEAIQVACVAVRIIEEGDSDFSGTPDEEDPERKPR